MKDQSSMAHIAPPIFSEGIEQSRKFAHQALERLDRHVIPPVPPNFHVWYEYASNRNPDLKRAIENLIAAREPFTPELCASLFQKYVRDLSPDPVTDEVTRQLVQTLTQLRSALANATSNTSSIDGDLREITGKIGSAAAAELPSLASALGRVTEHLAKVNSDLSSRVAASSKEIDDLQRNLRVAREAASRDSLTGIGNRQYFDASLAALMADARREGSPLTLALIDVDHFKAFNDTYGHTTGDAVLRLVARTLSANVKGRDIVARYGGEEFAVIFSRTSEKQALVVAQQILHAVQGLELAVVGRASAPPRITVSAGIAALQPDDTAIELIDRSDRALYEAKRTGRNKAVVATN